MINRPVTKYLVLKVLLGMMLALTFNSLANAMEYEVKERRAIHKDAVARTNRGIIRSIDLTNRYAMISGYLHDFGPLDSASRVKMLGSEHGSFEMLQVGMKVEVTFIDVGTNRIVVLVQQLPADADVGDA